MASRRFTMNVPCKEYVIERYKHLSIEEHMEAYMGLYEGDITDEEWEGLREHRLYVRFMCFQDGPFDSENFESKRASRAGSEAYMYAYCRPVEQMPEGHREEAQEFIRDGFLLGEINYARTGYFFAWPLKRA